MKFPYTLHPTPNTLGVGCRVIGEGGESGERKEKTEKIKFMPWFFHVSHTSDPSLTTSLLPLSLPYSYTPHPTP
ncbi:MAG: hypothetical protein F6J93_00740 [Oscillatoria sp. SIO1A7]|nr:hypothetical protein [Oscillatoria sp. SIO1A7]